jgi:hypothetical protein
MASIFVADTSVITADSTLITADRAPSLGIKYRPTLIYPPSTLGPILHDNYYAYQFQARDWDGDDIRFSLDIEDDIGFDSVPFSEDATGFDKGDAYLPPGLRLDPVTGWLYGRLNRQVEATRLYQFGIQVFKAFDAIYISDVHVVTMTVVTEFSGEVSWVGGADLGDIDNGAVSEFRVQVSNPLGTRMSYTIDPSGPGRLPPGLKLLDSGLIVGRVSFRAFFLDANTTTFDGGSTTVDAKYSFKVRARDSTGAIDISRVFTIKVLPVNDKPYENLYVAALLTAHDRNYLDTLLSDQTVFAPDVIYRPTDAYFGVASGLRFLSSYGLNPRPAQDYLAAMQTNHEFKTLRFGDIGKARAVSPDGTVRYEVVYVQMSDTLENAQRVSVPATITTALDQTLYPDSLMNMQRVMHENIGQANQDVLPDWMTSRQEDGKITNYRHVCVLAYVMPGHGEETAFKIQRYIDTGRFDFRNIQFDMDRYVWDSNLSKTYDKVLGRFNTEAETTFDNTGTLAQQTTFDDDNTRFFGYFDLYQAPDEDDKYLRFPQTGAI